jgi:hypothetical protein
MIEVAANTVTKALMPLWREAQDNEAIISLLIMCIL